MVVALVTLPRLAAVAVVPVRPVIVVATPAAEPTAYLRFVPEPKSTQGPRMPLPLIVVVWIGPVAVEKVTIPAVELRVIAPRLRVPPATLALIVEAPAFTVTPPTVWVVVPVRL